jgi:hypothetical protein
MIQLPKRCRQGVAAASGAPCHLSSNEARPPTFKAKVGRLLLRGGGRPPKRADRRCLSKRSRLPRHRPVPHTPRSELSVSAMRPDHVRRTALPDAGKGARALARRGMR